MLHQAWEYHQIRIPVSTHTNEPESWHEVVEAGHEGWELVFVTPLQVVNYQFVEYVFKRPYSPPTT